MPSQFSIRVQQTDSESYCKKAYTTEKFMQLVSKTESGRYHLNLPQTWVLNTGNSLAVQIYRQGALWHCATVYVPTHVTKATATRMERLVEGSMSILVKPMEDNAVMLKHIKMELTDLIDFDLYISKEWTEAHAELKRGKKRVLEHNKDVYDTVKKTKLEPLNQEIARLQAKQLAIQDAMKGLLYNDFSLETPETCLKDVVFLYE